MNARISRWLSHSALLPVLLVCGAALSISRGQDAAWDLKNYHIYNAWAFLHGHLTTDIAAAGLQSFFNPLPDVPYYWLGSGPLSDFPRLLAAFQGLWFGLLVYVLVRIALRHDALSRRSPDWLTLAAIVIGATGSMTWTQAGLCTNEVPLALLVLGGYLVVMPIAAGDLSKQGVGRVVAAGLLCGLAAGLKPTAIVYAPALAFALWAALGFHRRGLGLAFVLGVASVIGFAAAYGLWGIALERMTGNPIFPMFNQVFHSPWMPTGSGTDRQFMPKSPLQAIFYPFWWLRSNTTQGGNTFADWRYALAMVASLIYVGIAMSRPRDTARPRANVMLLSFVAVSWVLWLALYSILRYVVPIEALTGLVIMAALHAVIDVAPRLRTTRWPAVAALVLVVLIVATTRYTDWGHAPFGKKAFDIDVPAVPANSMVVMVSQPHAYVAAYMERAESIHFVGMTWFNARASGFTLDDKVKQALTTHTGPMYAVLRDDGGPDLDQLRAYIPAYTLSDCRGIRSQIEQTRRGRDLSGGLRICQINKKA